MRILIAPNPDNIPLHTWPAGGGRHEVLQLANRQSGECTEHPANSWPDLLSRCPPGWHPDTYICWSFEYRPVPEGIENADCFTVGVIGDWNLGGQAIHEFGGAFDLLVADRNGCERLRAAGFRNVLYWPLWAYDPGRHYLMPNVERDLDLVIVGNFNHHVQRERAPWLARVARLSRKCRVLVGSGIYGEDYTRVLNRAKIVFNRSIRGEINMRAYEAAACGALMFYERENGEIGDLFRDRVECVLYGEDDMEDLVAYYLEHDDERQRIAAAGMHRVTNRTYSDQAAGLFDQIQAWQAACSAPSRSFLELTHAERSVRLVRQWLTVAHSADLRRAENILLEMRDEAADAAERYCARVCLLEQYAVHATDPGVASKLRWDAIDLCRWLLKIDPSRAAARLNCAELLLSVGESEPAERELCATLLLLDAAHPGATQVEGPYIPRGFDAYTVEMERIWTAADAGSPPWRRRVADLLAWRCNSRLAEIALTKSTFDSAVERAQSAVSLQPELGCSWLLLARCHRAAGQLADAVTAYRRAFELVPVEPGIWQEKLSALHAIGAAAETLAFAEDLSAIIDGCPNFDEFRPLVERFSTAARQPRAFRTLVAAPDWSSLQSWQPLLTEFVRAFRRNADASLALFVDPVAEQDLDNVVCYIEDHLLGREGIPIAEWPDLHLIHKTPEELDLTDGTDELDAICPAPLGPSKDWLPGVPRMTVQTFHLAFMAHRPHCAARAA